MLKSEIRHSNVILNTIRERYIVGFTKSVFSAHNDKFNSFACQVEEIKTQQFF